jgi:ABC-type bacteriocin/lantibiotic exporter with double-glycine peptidase domain
MISFCQRDPRWAAQKLGASSLALGRYGCTTTCIADLSTYYGKEFNPSQVCSYIKYTSDGLVIWGSCQFSQYRFERREYGRNDANIKAALKNPDTSVILQVDGFHWVVATGTTVFGNYKIADPWFGDKATVSRYGRITGAAYFRKT